MMDFHIFQCAVFQDQMGFLTELEMGVLHLRLCGSGYGGALAILFLQTGICCYPTSKGKWRHPKPAQSHAAGRNGRYCAPGNAPGRCHNLDAILYY